MLPTLSIQLPHPGPSRARASAEAEVTGLPAGDQGFQAVLEQLSLPTGGDREEMATQPEAERTEKTLPETAEAGTGSGVPADPPDPDAAVEGDPPWPVAALGRSAAIMPGNGAKAGDAAAPGADLRPRVDAGRVPFAVITRGEGTKAGGTATATGTDLRPQVDAGRAVPADGLPIAGHLRGGMRPATDVVTFEGHGLDRQEVPARPGMVPVFPNGRFSAAPGEVPLSRDAPPPTPATGPTKTVPNDLSRVAVAAVADGPQSGFRGLPSGVDLAAAGQAGRPFVRAPAPAPAGLVPAVGGVLAGATAGDGLDPGLVAERRAAPDAAPVVRIAAPPPQHHNVELARQVAVQILEATQNARSGAIDLTLNPAELGRVRLLLVPGDASLAVTILAERPETLDLMRRHIDMLAEDFREMGYGSASFSFGRGQEDAPRATAESAVPVDPASAGPPRPDVVSATRGLSDRIDIRL